MMLASAGLIAIAGTVIWWAGSTTAAFTVFLTIYPLEAAALLVIVRGTSWRQDKAGLLDTAMISVGLTLVCWLLVITPLVCDSHTRPIEVLTALFSFGDVLLISVLVRFFTSRGHRNTAFWQISAALLLQTIAHWSTLLPVLFAIVTPNLRPLTSLSALLFAGAALHPSMRELASHRTKTATEMSLRRVLLVNLACMGAPVLLITQGILQDGQVDWVAAGIGCMLLFALVTLRPRPGVCDRGRPFGCQLASLLSVSSRTGPHDPARRRGHGRANRRTDEWSKVAATWA